MSGELKSADIGEDEVELSAVPKLPTKDESPVSQTAGSVKRAWTSPVPFFSGNPMVEHTAGILHLYKDEYVFIFLCINIYIIYNIILCCVIYYAFILVCFYVSMLVKGF